MASVPVYGQPDSNLWSPKPLQTEQEESLQRSHGGRLCLPSGLLPWHEVSLTMLLIKGIITPLRLIVFNRWLVINYVRETKTDLRDQMHLFLWEDSTVYLNYLNEWKVSEQNILVNQKWSGKTGSRQWDSIIGMVSMLKSLTPFL